MKEEEEEEEEGVGVAQTGGEGARKSSWREEEVEDGDRVVRYHCGGGPEEVNSCVLNSYMVYL